LQPPSQATTSSKGRPRPRAAGLRDSEWPPQWRLCTLCM
jgi:hypothetical protein